MGVENEGVDVGGGAVKVRETKKKNRMKGSREKRKGEIGRIEEESGRNMSGWNEG